MNGINKIIKMMNGIEWNIFMNVLIIVLIDLFFYKLFFVVMKSNNFKMSFKINVVRVVIVVIYNVLLVVFNI